jgi:hypothetical protein
MIIAALGAATEVLGHLIRAGEALKLTGELTPEQQALLDARLKQAEAVGAKSDARIDSRAEAAKKRIEDRKGPTPDLADPEE